MVVFDKTKEAPPSLLLHAKERDIVRWAVISRAIVLTLQFVSNLTIPDHQADAFIFPKTNLSQTIIDDIIHTSLHGFIRWDAQYFMHVAKYGYTFENAVAFFPLYPMLVGYTATALSYFLWFLNADTLTILVFITLNTYVFLKSALLLYRLTFAVMKDISFAYKSAILFCFNPASIFFSAPYTECLFCYLTFKSIWHCINMKADSVGHFKFRDVFACVIYISLSTCTRSNGLLNVGFFVYFYSSSFFRGLSQFRVIFACRSLLLLVIYSGLCVVPFALVQIYSYNLFCRDFDHGLPKFLVDFALQNKLVLPGSFGEHNQSWCRWSLPLAYSYVQKHYWNVGFLQYYVVKQIPNFLLALPVVLIVLDGSFNVFQRLLRFHLLRRRLCGCGNALFVCTVHVLALTIFCVLCIHVQVTTRMVFSASPAIYWFCARAFAEDGLKWKRMFVKYYFVSYFVLGTVLFCNNLPWT